jgi:hypothetical protein
VTTSAYLTITKTHEISRKPKNARSKRALEAREPKEIEDPRTCLFIKGTKTGEVLNGVVKDLVRIFDVNSCDLI